MKNCIVSIACEIMFVFIIQGQINETFSLKIINNEKTLRYDEICQTIPDQYDTTKHFYHRWCYQMFTNISRFTKSRDATEEESKRRVLRRESNEQSASSSCSSVLFLKVCLFLQERKQVEKSQKRSISQMCQQLLHYRF